MYLQREFLWLNKSSSLPLESVRRNRKKIIPVSLRIRSTGIKLWLSLYCVSQNHSRDQPINSVCRFVYRAQCSINLKQTLKPRNSRATLSQSCGWLTISRKVQCHLNTATIFDFYQLELVQISLQQDTVQTCPFAFTHQWIILALK